jgi:hypothetical protein
LIDNTTKHYTDVFTNLVELNSVIIINSHGVIYVLGFFVAGFLFTVFVVNIMDFITYQKDNYFKIYKQNIEIEKQKEQKEKQLTKIKENLRQIKNYSSPNLSPNKNITSPRGNKNSPMKALDYSYKEFDIRTPDQVSPSLANTHLSVGKISLSSKTPPLTRTITKRPINNTTNDNSNANNNGNNNGSQKTNFVSQALTTNISNNDSNKLSKKPFILTSIDDLDEDQQNKFNNETTDMKLKFDKSLPNILRSYSPFYIRFCREMGLHHKWISIFTHYSIDYPRFVSHIYLSLYLSYTNFIIYLILIGSCMYYDIRNYDSIRYFNIILPNF